MSSFFLADQSSCSILCLCLGQAVNLDNPWIVQGQSLYPCFEGAIHGLSLSSSPKPFASPAQAWMHAISGQSTYCPNSHF